MSVIIKPSPTYEQTTAIDNARLGKSFKVIAYAGTGKTTTLQMISDAMPERRGMYLAFNKAIASEAQSKFHRQVDCRTFHSLAYRSVPRGVTDKLRLPRLSPSFIAKEYRLEPITLRRMMGGRYEKYVLMPSRLAKLGRKCSQLFLLDQFAIPCHGIYKHLVGCTQTTSTLYKTSLPCGRAALAGVD